MTLSILMTAYLCLIHIWWIIKTFGMNTVLDIQVGNNC